jgi:hypothetical protein
MTKDRRIKQVNLGAVVTGAALGASWKFSNIKQK